MRYDFEAIKETVSLLLFCARKGDETDFKDSARAALDRLVKQIAS